MTTLGSNSEGDRERELALYNSDDMSTSAWLAACGHPGYSDNFAAQVLSVMSSRVGKDKNLNSHRAIHLLFQRAGQ